MYGWGTEEEEDIWELELDFGGGVERAGAGEAEMTVGELTEWRYIKAEREKELVNICPSFVQHLLHSEGGVRSAIL